MSNRESNRDMAGLGRQLMRCGERAVLATSLRGSPYASLVLVAVDLDASPLMLLSDLAQHSRNIAFDPRVSLLLDGTEGHADRLDGPRLTVLGRVEATTDPRLLARFTARHPSSALYAGFADFRVYRLVVERGHLVAGFGRIEWIEAADLLFPGDIAALAAAEPAIVTQMNRDHAEMVNLFPRTVPDGDKTGWVMTGIDPDGIDLRREGKTARVDFPAPATTPEAARAGLVQLAEKARR
jgi:heme iron utilization protein